MISKGAFIASVTLALLVAAPPLEHDQQQRRGAICLPKYFMIKPIAALPSHIQARFCKRQAESLMDENDVEGVPSSWYKSLTCSSKSKYSASTSSSSSSSEQSGIFEIKYSDLSILSYVSGPVHTNTSTIAIASINVKGQTFFPVTTLSSSFADNLIEDIFGLAFPSVSSLNAAHFFVSANSQSAVASNEFGFFLASSSDSISFKYHDVDPSTIFWQITGVSIASGGTSAISGFNTIINSATTFMYGPPSAIQQFYKFVPGAQVFDSIKGFYTFPCNNVPDVLFCWGGGDCSISANSFNLRAALASQDFVPGLNPWLLGDRSNIYTGFSFDRNTVGFSHLSHDSNWQSTSRICL
ncbi:hypothetical protein GYMLUDRAFT_78145 [Collybiopsis luxurians FD-317 M1]|uniref:Peptidase A1 domain-containing protein n=1 Tax=Collybiopsis luxurians FD-317 M1 TaxID=944289 RepID=A0A0D0C9V5_9AGAR|nr:hypothetical protein GYMLUDRAFT_78145 [Collybiopsis luxurians FD-317 M1]